MKNPQSGFGLFGTADDIAVQRGIAEFQAGRPVLIAAHGECQAALPVDGLTQAACDAFRALCAPAEVGLVVTARRARVLGFDVPGPLLIPLSGKETRDTIWSIAAGLDGKPRPQVESAGEAAAQAVVLAKLAQRLPALMVADAGALAPVVRTEMIAVKADAVARFGTSVVDTLEIVSEARIPLEDGVTARFCVFRDAVGATPVAIIVGDPDFSAPVAVRVHSACLTGDVFGSRRCDCGAQLKLAVAQLSESGGGVVLYLEQEGRGLGLANKMRAYELQDGGLDTMDANMMLGFDDDERDYGVAARMLRMIGAKRVLLLTNNPGKLEALSEGGVDIAARVPLHTRINPENRRYLATKAARAGHWLEGMLESAKPGRDAIGSTG
ncbi:MAG: GTP cyclohydrolase II RibA [Xanthobacteraceae bacterium]|nr:GTP cyclohydrolase II RibA [Xanthobacteraceae bacterium]